MSTTKRSASSKGHNRCMMSRRDFLLYSGAATTVSIIPLTLFAGTSSETEVDARVVGYQRKKIAQLSNLKNHEPVYFQYPDDGPNSVAMLVKADIECGGGLGLEKDVVAFSMTCTHQGGPLTGAIKRNRNTESLGSVHFTYRHLICVDMGSWSQVKHSKACHKCYLSSMAMIFTPSASWG